MAMYGLAVLPLIKKLAEEAKQVWYADEATGGGKLEQLRRWWDKLNECGPAFGYFPNAVKTWLIVERESACACQGAVSRHWCADHHRRPPSSWCTGRDSAVL